ncbi:MAG: ankyrin repeat domain-containing protein [Phycisphaerales bacterium]|nr:ankyrin repeat domain-containing protein [Phycisphaerales bacterium]
MNGLDRIVTGVVLGLAVFAAGCDKKEASAPNPEAPAKDATTQPDKNSNADTGKSPAQLALAAAAADGNTPSRQATQSTGVNRSLPNGAIPMDQAQRIRAEQQEARSRALQARESGRLNIASEVDSGQNDPGKTKPGKSSGEQLASPGKTTPPAAIDPSLRDPENLPGWAVTTSPRTTPSGLQFYDIDGGVGFSPATSASRVTVHYTGYLPDGTKFDSSVDRGRPSTFALNGVISGWTEGVGSMRVGGKRKLVIPAPLAYGEAGRPPTIPANSTLVFDIELIQVHDAAGQADGQPVTINNPAGEPAEPASTEVMLELTPASLDLGNVAAKQLGSGPVKLTNISDKPITIERAKTNCGCTTSDFVPNTVLQPGESSEITINLRGASKAVPVTKTVTFMVKDAAPVKMQVSLNTILYVTATPEEYDNVLNPDGKITLRAVDDQPFAIVSVSPPIVGEFSSEEAVEHELTLPWDSYWQNVTTVGGGKMLNIHTTHPLAEQVSLRVKLDPDGRAQLNDIIKDRVQASAPGRTPGQQSVGAQRNELSSLVKRGDVDRLKELIDGGADVNTRGKSGVTLLGQASQNGNIEMVEFLIDSGAELETADQVGRTPLMTASQAKDAAVTRALLEAGADVRARDPFVGNALSWHAAFGSADSVQELVDFGSDVEVVSDQTGFTPLVWASGFGDSEAVTILIDAGARLDVVDVTDGSSALHHAAKTGSVAHLQALINGNANLEMIDRNGKTALHAAAGHRNGGVDKIRLLVESGANIDAKDNRGLTAFEIARDERSDGGKTAVVEYLETASRAGSEQPTEEPSADDSDADSGSE